jgi:GAF domain-containing protein
MSTPSTVSSGSHFPIDPNISTFPFRRQLSLAPLVEFWTQTGPDDPEVTRTIARVVADALRAAPELSAPIEDPAVLDRHRELVALLMSRVFPPASWEQDYGAACHPFNLLAAFYATPSFRRELVGDDGMLRGLANVDARTVETVRLFYAYGAILRKYYGIELGFDYPIIVTTTDPDSGLARHFKLQFDRRFLELEAVGEPPALSDAARQRLLANLADPAVLMELLPPERFVFRGFMVFRALDVTDQEVLSALKRDLIEKESIVSDARFQGLQEKLRTYLRRPELQFGLAAIQGEQVYLLNYGSRIRHSCIFSDSTHRLKREFIGSIYERAIAQGQPFIVEDLATYPGRTAVEDAMLELGMRNVLVAPLVYQDELIGTLKLGSPRPGDLTAMSALKLREVLPLFSMAVKRSIEELNARVEAIIKEKCTAIHPSVEWRFRRAALNAIERRGAGGGVELEPIVFTDVHPLYAVSDIRGSSTERNAAIQADLITHLTMAREVVQLAREARHLPILDELAYRIGKRIDQVELALGSGDELAVLAFLRQDVEPRFRHLEGFSPGVRERIAAYRTALDPRVGTIYRRRKEYEESVALINDAISTYLDAEQEMAQAMFPHYFEKQRTDGIDYSIYVGASLVENGVFDELYLRNLRLWQLMVTCGIARRSDALRGRLPVPLDTAHLILVQHAPLAISFRFDEKRFDVDGAYNVRYEVMKKRIDKAVVKGGTERITEPGRIAVVYSQPAEAAEYRQYLDYLRASRYLTGQVEELELEELQGVQGLRALRVAVDLGDPGPAPRATMREASAAVQTLRR